MKFALGEQAKLVGGLKQNDPTKLCSSIVTVIQLGPIKFIPNELGLLIADYKILSQDGKTFGAIEAWLEKLPPQNNFIPAWCRNIFEIQIKDKSPERINAK